MLKIKELYNKYKEIINYLIFGVLTTVVSLVVYYISVFTFLNPDNPIQLQIANILSWIAGVTFAYITNRKFVFQSKEQNKLKEATKFVASRIVTLILDMVIMWFGVTILHENDKIIKLLSQVIVVIANYVFSKLIVFKENKKMKNRIQNFIQQAIAIIFSILFAVALINAIFFNKTVGINYNIIFMLVGTIIIYIIMFVFYYLYKKNNKSFLERKPKKTDYFLVVTIIFFIQFILAKFTYARYGWDCGKVISDVYGLINSGKFEFLYYAQYPNNIGIFIIIKNVIEIAKYFVDVQIIYNCFLSAMIFNIIMVDIASIFTFLTIKKVIGNKSAYLSLIFIFPLMLFSPYINIPYTDTISMLFPIIILYLYICIKELPKERIKKYILSFLLGMLMLIGVFIKPTVIIMPIAIIIIGILNLNKEKLKNIVYSIIVMIFFIMGCGISYLGYNIQKNQIFGELISKQAQEDFKRSYTHFLMMGMQERQNDVIGDGKNQTLYGTYNVQDDLNTYSIKGYKEKQEYNLKIIKERLKNFGIIGYIKFLYNKANWILSDGTFYYGYEGTWIVDGYQNQNKVAKIVQKFITVDSKAYKYITANIMQISWLIILLGLMLSYSKEKNEYLDIGKLAIIGIILFILIFEGRARYLVNYIPIFIFIGVDGLKISLNKILTMKDK